ncbi:MAG: hypothetical protein HOM68_06755 [Gemmatimonadetes bacterium]|jgi:hypothetical protein|nr:hypothetical protein [Gemmatimonadota bacterium]MBT4610147.1 hypothetical protein [Gemmatimonadota bacterium]MBT5056221.1 hypothetical protein [Gemmatimonadota bacterium]MBT5146324.1 hypothetical protein [Gemmatimonadota bacterium]MBT5591247.1 hypothetical protein [Gemmatimonadota bacterium]
MQLTEPQRQFFDRFGYLVIRGLLSPDEVEQVTSAFEWSINHWGAGEEHDGSRRTMFGGPIEHAPQMCALMDHPGVLGLIGGVTGDDFNYCGGDGNYYVGDTGWHPDGNWGQLWATKTAFYLDSVRADTGCLRVIPGSHHPDHFLRQNKIDPNQSLEMFGVPPSQFPGNTALESDPGDVVIFNHDLYHAAFGGGQRRRMFTMNCTRRPTSPAELELSRQYISVHSPGGYKVDTGAGMFFPTMLDTADEKRMKHLRQPAELHDELFPQFARNAGARAPHRGRMGSS